MATVIVFGGTDKARYTNRLAKYYKCKSVVDNWYGQELLPHTLAFTNLFPPFFVKNCIVVNIDFALELMEKD